jgi:hypothetical protein
MIPFHMIAGGDHETGCREQNGRHHRRRHHRQKARDLREEPAQNRQRSGQITDNVQEWHFTVAFLSVRNHYSAAL